MKNLQNEARRILKEAGIENPALEARLILKHVMKVSDADLILGDLREATHEERNEIQDIINHRALGLPLSKIFGVKEFWGLEFEVNEHVLDPRPDTETIVEAALKFFGTQGRQPEWILDLGTGTGCLIISLLSEFPGAGGVAVDKSPEALEVTKRNIKRHKLGARVQEVQGSWFTPVDGKFDLIVSNPPYIATEEIKTLESSVKNYDPILALDGGEDGLRAYESIFSSLE